MSSETLPTSAPERAPQNAEFSGEQLEQYRKAESALEQNIEKATIENSEQAEAQARSEALKEAVSVESGSAEKKRKEPSASPAHRRHGVVSKKERTASYKRHMKQLQAELPPVQRGFSKTIHNPVVEKTSEAIGSTIARPNALLAGSMFAFFAVLIVYLLAKHLGYTLSGFETIGAFIVGWTLGILYDFFKVMITGKK